MKKKADLTEQETSPCVGCDHNFLRNRNVRRNGKVLCGIDDQGNKIKSKGGDRKCREVEAEPPGTYCFALRRAREKLVSEAREARELYAKRSVG